jgi:L-threonylcarbamoyladenylate synthase
MDTKVVFVDEKHIDMQELAKAGELIKQGELVAFPTETVYGLGGDALKEDSARKIYEAKGRPSDNPLIIHIAKWEDIHYICKDIPKAAKKLADAFWPGPLTMILKKTDVVPMATTGGLETVAVRLPSHEVAKAFIEAAGGYVAAPSANVSGRPSPTLAKYVFEDMEGKIPLIIDGGVVGIGVESTIVDLTEETPVILRPGYITYEMLQEVLGRVSEDVTMMESLKDVAPKAPGMKYRHYAPKGSLTIVDGDTEAVIAYINEACKEAALEGKRTGVLCTSETAERYTADCIKCIGSRADENTVAQGLYKVLRECDDEQLEVLFAESFETEGIGQAIMNRLLKAAGHQVIQL